MTHQQHADNVGAYALGALPAPEATSFERHLMGCEACQEELREAQRAVDALARSVTPIEPPPALRESLMAAVSADLAPALASRRRAWIPRLRPALALAAASVALGFAAGSVLTPPADPRTVAADVDHTRLPDGTADLLIPENDGRGAVLRVQGLPDPGRGRVYQVWVQRGDDVIPVSIFDVDSNGRGAAAIPGSLEGVSAVMVTRERRGGAAAPTEAPAITADV